MNIKNQVSFMTFLLLISFASVNAVLFTPALPDIAVYFRLTTAAAQNTMTWFLIGYSLGQLIYGPLANRYGRKTALYAGISCQIASSLLCALAGTLDAYFLLVLGRFLLALGSGVGLKMTFTMINETYETKVASQKIAYLMLAFAITPGLAITVGGIVTQWYGWQSCFYIGAVYGALLLALVRKLPETQKQVDVTALHYKHLLAGYKNQFTNKRLLAGGFLMGGCTAFIYAFAAVAPFIAINMLGMSSKAYGMANLLPPIGLICGSLCSATLAKRLVLGSIVKIGLYITVVGVMLMIIAAALRCPALFSMFLPMIIIYFGLSFVIANASSMAMSYTTDKAHGSAVMNFINMGSATVVVCALGVFSISSMILPLMYVALCFAMLGIYSIFLDESLIHLR